MKIDLATNEVVEIVGAISDREVKRAERVRAERVVARNATRLLRAWTKIHGSD